LLGNIDWLHGSVPFVNIFTFEDEHTKIHIVACISVEFIILGAVLNVRGEAIIVCDNLEFSISIFWNILSLKYGVFKFEEGIERSSTRELSTISHVCPSIFWSSHPSHRLGRNIVENCVKELMHWMVVRLKLAQRNSILTKT
jgi:hypothetical protein